MLKAEDILFLDKTALFYNDLTHDLYEENGYILYVKLDTYQQHKYYYIMGTEDGKKFDHFVGINIYGAIEKFNQLCKR